MSDPILTPERISSIVDSRHTSDQCPWPVVCEIAVSHEALRARADEAEREEKRWYGLFHEHMVRADNAERRVAELEAALRFKFLEMLPDLDYEDVVIGSGDEEHGGPVYDWAWAQHPWFGLLGLSRDTCVAYLAALSAAPPEEETA